MNIELVLTNITIAFCVVVTFVLGVFALVRSSKRRAAVTFFVLTLSVDIFYLSHYFGINAATPEASRAAFMWNLINVGLVCFNYQFIYEMFGQKTLARKIFLILSYVTGIAYLIFFLIYPDTFLLNSVPKMYLPYYYVPGPLYWILRVHFFIVSTFILIDLFSIYSKGSKDERNRIIYIFLGSGFGYVMGSTAVFLIYDVQVDPLYAMFFGLYTIPFIYCFLKYDLMDFHIFARRALMYASYIVMVGLFIVFINAANNILLDAIPGFPFWLVPFISACIVVLIGGFVWHQVSILDKLKYEFVTIVTHKFRTPLTYIVWSADTIEKSDNPEDRKRAVELIKTGSAKLVELTDLLMGLQNAEGNTYEYKRVNENVGEIVRELAQSEALRMKVKGQHFSLHLPENPVIVSTDRRRLEFALQILLENAISYTPKGGTVELSVEVKDKECQISIKDSGIGMTDEELPYVFTKFFRGKEARAIDTEGMGIGLHIAKQIMQKLGGEVLARSGGRNLGSVFTASLSLLKSSDKITS